MPKIFEYFGMVFFFYANEHDPKHVHIKQGECENKVDLIFDNGILMDMLLKKSWRRRWVADEKAKRSPRIYWGVPHANCRKVERVFRFAHQTAERKNNKIVVLWNRSDCQLLKLSTLRDIRWEYFLMINRQNMSISVSSSYQAKIRSSLNSKICGGSSDSKFKTGMLFGAKTGI